MIAIIIPVLNRPQNAAKVVESIRESASVPYSIWFMCSPMDEVQQGAVRALGLHPFVVNWEPGAGDFAKKTNTGFNFTAYPEIVEKYGESEFVFLGADDLEFQFGWDVAAIEALESAQVGVCGTQDGGNPQVKRGLHSTHSLVRRAYIEECGGTWDNTPGVVYHEGYDHQWVDAELVAVAKERDCWTFAHASRVTHLHPFWDKSVEQDATYAKALDSASARHDSELFRARQRQYA